MTEYRSSADSWDELFNFDAFITTPRNLNRKVAGYFDAEGNYHPNQAMVDEWEEK